MILIVANAVACALVLAALVTSARRRSMWRTPEGRAVVVLLGVLVLLSSVGLIRRFDPDRADLAARGSWTAVAAVAMWVMTQRGKRAVRRAQPVRD